MYTIHLHTYIKENLMKNADLKFEKEQGRVWKGNGGGMMQF